MVLPGDLLWNFVTEIPKTWCEDFQKPLQVNIIGSMKMNWEKLLKVGKKFTFLEKRFGGV